MRMVATVKKKKMLCHLIRFYLLHNCFILLSVLENVLKFAHHLTPQYWLTHRHIQIVFGTHQMFKVWSQVVPMCVCFLKLFLNLLSHVIKKKTGSFLLSRICYAADSLPRSVIAWIIFTERIRDKVIVKSSNQRCTLTANQLGKLRSSKVSIGLNRWLAEVQPRNKGTDFFVISNHDKNVLAVSTCPPSAF